MKLENIKVGTYVYFTSVGICEVKAIENVNGNDCFVLETIDERNACKLFVPISNQEMTNKIHHVLTKDEIERILNDSQYNFIDWNQNRKERTEQFSSILRSYDFVNILAMVRCLLIKSKELREEKKRLSTFDSDILAKAQSLIDEMLSFSLKIPKREVREYILNIIGA